MTLFLYTEEGFMSYKDPEDTRRPRAVYDINPAFEVFN